MELYLFLFISWYIHYVNSQSTPCGSQYKPIIEICRNNNLTTETTVYITTSSVPTFQQTFCNCSISANTSQVNISLSFVDDIVPQSLSFEIDDIELRSSPNKFTFNLINQSLTLSVLNNVNYTREGGCLKISTNNPFNILCNQTINFSTSVPSLSPVTATSPVSHSQSSVKPNKHNDNKTDTNGTPILVPAVASITAVVCLVTVTVVVICCRRKASKRNKQPKVSNQSVSKTNVNDNDDDYYMTENPMYQRGLNAEKNFDASDVEYHYIEPDKKSKEVHSDGSQRFPDSKQFQGNVKADDNHYEYSACVTSSQKRNSSTEKKTRHKYINSAPNENTYDTNDKVSTRQFEGFNEYHQLSKVGQMNVAVVDIYNTIGNTSQYPNEENQERF